MTLPITTIFPLPPEGILDNGDGFAKYMRELVFSLQRQYEDTAQAVNGDMRRSVDTGSTQWTPKIIDSANAGTTFTYDHQVGFVLRQGLVVDLWFDVQWTANIGAITGSMQIDLPYKVAVTTQKPFVGVLQSSVFAYTAGTESVINAQPDTYRANVWNVGSGFTTANQGSVAAGHLIGNIRYVGQGIERN